VILVSRFGILFETSSDSKWDVEGYSKLLGLPSLASILSEESSGSGAIAEVITKWADQFHRYSVAKGESTIVDLRSPVPFTLMSLPARFEDLYELAFRHVCVKCGMTPSVPVVCLVCGDILPRCCEGQQITHGCSGDATVYFMIKVCCAFY
jgi:E3 ubiquitin-protein ligase UBR1